MPGQSIGRVCSSLQELIKGTDQNTHVVPVNQPSNKRLPHFLLCSSLMQEALSIVLTSFFGGMGKGTAKNTASINMS